MHGIGDIDQTASADDGDELDPREAARLLARTGGDARRQFSLSPPRVSAFMAAVILAGYAVLWLSTRGQHPYQGPSGAAVAAIYSAVAVAVAVSVMVYRRATAGISGPSVRQQRVEGTAILLSYLGSPLIQGAMHHYGAGPTIVYGVIPAAGPLIIVGTTVLGVAASKADWPQFAAALAVVVAGIVALFVGPSAAWLAAGIGVFVGVAGYAAANGPYRR